MEINSKIIGIINTNYNIDKEKVIHALKLKKEDKLKLYKKSRKYKKEIEINKEINSNYELIKLNIWNDLYKGKQKITLIEPNLILDYKEQVDLMKLLKHIKLKFNVCFKIFSNDTDFLISLVDYVFIKNHDIIVAQGSKFEILGNKELLLKNKIKVPEIIDFKSFVYKKTGINLMNRDNINDLIKDIYRMSDK